MDVSTPFEIPHAELRYVHLRASRAFTWLGRVVAAYVGVVCGLLLAGVTARIPPLLYTAFFVAPCFALLSAFTRKSPFKTTGRLIADDRFLRVGKQTIARGAVVEGIAFARKGACEVELALRDGGRVAIRVATLDDGDRILEALGVDPQRRCVTVRWTHTLGAICVWSLVFGLGECLLALYVSRFGDRGAYLFFLLYCVVPFFAAFVARAAATHETTVGADGVMHGWRWFRRFVPFDSVVKVDAIPEYVCLRRAGDRTTLVRTSPHDPNVTRALLRRIESARVRARETAMRLPLAREGRSVSAWRTALAEQLREGHGYRRVPITHESAAAIVDDPTMPAELRIGAALALSTVDSADARARVRVVVNACASPRLRVALEHAAEGALSDAEVDAAIAELGEAAVRRGE